MAIATGRLNEIECMVCSKMVPNLMSMAVSGICIGPMKKHLLLLVLVPIPPWHAHFDNLMHSAITVRSLSGWHSVRFDHSAASVILIRKRSDQNTIRSVRHNRRPVISQWQALSSTWDVVTAQTLALSTGEMPMLSGVLDKGEQHALLLSTLAGLSTSIGGAIAIVRKPGNDLLSFLLGIAIGVMATLSVLEMWLHNAFEHGPVAITAATAVGVALYYIAQPYFPDFESHQASSNMALAF